MAVTSVCVYDAGLRGTTTRPKNAAAGDLADAPDHAVVDGKTFLDVSVRNPILHHVKGDLHTSYDIAIETNNSSFTMSRSVVRRRYSEFRHLRSLLNEQQPSLVPPRMPSRTLLLKRFDSEFIENRRRGLETFLRLVLSEPLYLSNKSLHLFIQTNLTMAEIEDVVRGTDAGNSPEARPPIVLALRDDVFDEIGDSAYESADYGRTPKGILRSDCGAVLHSFKCFGGESHCHLRIGSSISVCTPTLHVPSPEGRASSCPLARSVSLMATLKTSASDCSLETLARKKVSFSSSVQIL
ncbi:sorting nexin-10 isoform X1 [Ixodes scapularis]